MKPIRPTPITAAAVILIVLSAQCLLVLLAIVAAVLLDQLGVPILTLAFLECCGCSCIAVIFPLGLYFLKVGLELLEGRTVPVNVRILGVQFGVSGAFSAVLWFCLTVMLIVNIRIAEGYQIILFFLTLLFDSIALLVAGVLMQRNDQSYKDWQNALVAYKTEPEYEVEE